MEVIPKGDSQNVFRPQAEGKTHAQGVLLRFIQLHCRAEADATKFKEQQKQQFKITKMNSSITSTELFSYKRNKQINLTSLLMLLKDSLQYSMS